MRQRQATASSSPTLLLLSGDSLCRPTVASPHLRSPSARPRQQSPALAHHITLFFLETKMMLFMLEPLIIRLVTRIITDSVFVTGVTVSVTVCPPNQDRLALHLSKQRGKEWSG
jgi:hypothetical protein